VPVCEPVPLRLAVTLGLGVQVCEPVPLRLPVTLELGVPVCEPVPLWLPVALELGVPVCEPVPLRLAVALELTVPVCEPVLLRLPVALEDAVPVCEPVTEIAMVEDAVVDELAVLLAVMEAEGVRDGVTSEAKLRPRYMGTDTLPSAASQLPSTDSLMPPFQPLDGMSWVMLDRRTQGADSIVLDGTVALPDE